MGWTAGRNVRIDTRWSSGESENYRKYALELLALSPDLILASTSTAVAALQKASRNVPIVFVSVIDRSAPAWLQAWHDQVGIPPALPSSNTG